MTQDSTTPLMTGNSMLLLGFWNIRVIISSSNSFCYIQITRHCPTL